MPGEKEGFVYGPTDQAYYVSDIPMLKQRIKDNPGSAVMLQPIIDRLEAGDFDKFWGPPDDDTPPPGTDTDPTGEEQTTDPGDYSYKGVTAKDIMKYLGEVSQLTPEQMGVADVNQDGEVSIGDALWILQMAKGLRDPDTLEGIPQPDPEIPGEETPAPGAQNQEDIDAAIAAALEAAGLKDFNFSDVMTAADAKELFQGMDTGQIEANVLQKMGLPDFLTNEQVQNAINTALGESDYLSEEDVLRMIQDSTGADVDLSNYMSKSDIADAIKASTSHFLTPEMIQQMITNAQLQGMNEEDIFAMIQDVSGGTMSDEDIMNAIATAQETQYTSLMDQVNKLIADSLAQGMNEQEILALIQTEYGEQMSDDEILQAIADAQEGQYTSLMDEVNALIADALTQGMSPEQIAALIKEQYGDQMSDDEILNAITTAQEGQYTSLMEEVNALIAEKLAEGWDEQAILELIQTEYGDQMSADDIMAAIATAQETQYTSLMEEVNALIAQALTEGMSPEQIAALIKEQYGDQMTDDQILQAIATAQEGVPTIQEIEAMIADALANGMSPEAIQTMISDYLGDSGLLSADDIATMIADAVAGIGTTTGGDALTSDAVQQMIDAAISGMPAGLSTEDVQAMLGESGYMGDTGVQGMIDAALQGSLGQGGSINEAIQNALLAVGDTTIDTGTQQPSSPYGTYTSPYGDVDPYALMYNPWYGTTPFAGGTTTGAESGLAGLDLGNPGDYNFDISTEYDEDLFS